MRRQVPSGTNGRLRSVLSELKHEDTKDTRTHEGPRVELAGRSRLFLRASLCSSCLRAPTAQDRSRGPTYSGQDLRRPAWHHAWMGGDRLKCRRFNLSRRSERLNSRQFNVTAGWIRPGAAARRQVAARALSPYRP